MHVKTEISNIFFNILYSRLKKVHVLHCNTYDIYLLDETGKSFTSNASWAADIEFVACMQQSLHMSTSIS
jgi:hypothetical protein